MTIDDAIATLRGRENGYEAQRLPVSHLFAEPEFLRANEIRYRLTDDGFVRLSRQLGAPPAYLMQLDPPTRATVMQYHLDHGDLDQDEVTLITRGNDFVAIDPRPLHRLTGTQVVNAVVEAVESPELQVHDLLFDDEAFQLELVGELQTAEVAPGDVLLAGLQVKHSFIGENATCVQSFIYRLICRNGLTYRQCVASGTTRTRRLPADRPDAHQLQLAQVRRLATETWLALRSKLQAITALQHEKIEVANLLTRWLERARLSTRRLMPELEAAWNLEGGRQTAYDAMNALTRVATHASGLDIRIRRILAGLAGVLAFRQLHFCPHCFSRLAAAANSAPSVGAMHTI